MWDNRTQSCETECDGNCLGSHGDKKSRGAVKEKEEKEADASSTTAGADDGKVGVKTECNDEEVPTSGKARRNMLKREKKKKAKAKANVKGEGGAEETSQGLQ